jgi:hypothetical protein
MYEGFRCKHLKDRKECAGCSIVLGKKTGSLYDPDIQHMPPGSIIPVPPGFMKGTIKGVSKDVPKTVNEQGGGQSEVSYGFDCLDPKAMFAMTEALEEGRKEYGKNNWRKISVEDHINHMLIHIFAYMAGDTQDDHLGHAMCRAMFAKAVDITNNERNDEDL